MNNSNQIEIDVDCGIIKFVSNNLTDRSKRLNSCMQVYNELKEHLDSNNISEMNCIDCFSDMGPIQIQVFLSVVYNLIYNKQISGLIEYFEETILNHKNLNKK